MPGWQCSVADRTYACDIVWSELGIYYTMYAIDIIIHTQDKPAYLWGKIIIIIIIQFHAITHLVLHFVVVPQ